MSWLTNLFKDHKMENRIKELEKLNAELEAKINSDNIEHLKERKTLVEKLDVCNTDSLRILQMSEDMAKAFVALYNHSKNMANKFKTTLDDVGSLISIRDRMKNKRISLTQAENELNSAIQVIYADLNDILDKFNKINQDEIIQKVMDKKYK